MQTTNNEIRFKINKAQNVSLTWNKTILQAKQLNPPFQISYTINLAHTDRSCSSQASHHGRDPCRKITRALLLGCRNLLLHTRPTSQLGLMARYQSCFLGIYGCISLSRMLKPCPIESLRLSHENHSPSNFHRAHNFPEKTIMILWRTVLLILLKIVHPSLRCSQSKANAKAFVDL